MKTWIALLVGCGVSLAGCRAKEAAPTELGKVLYTNHCAACHGAAGDGNGPLAAQLDPKPRDLTTGIYKYRSTRGAFPTNFDMLHTMKTGIPGSSMPGWDLLGQKEWEGLLAYVKSLAPRLREKHPAAPPISIPSVPPSTPASVAAGQKLYTQSGCTACHGTEGHGDGTAAATLTDVWNDRIRPRDLTKGPYKWGTTPREIYRTLLVGVPGTPMPGFEQAFTNEQLWQLTHYLQSILRLPQGYDPSTPKRFLLSVGRAGNATATTDPAAAEWQSVTAVPLFLKAMRYDRRNPEWVMAKALHTDSTITFYLTWEDDHQDADGTAQDGVALQFPAKPIKNPADLPFLGMGHTDHAVRMWDWRPSGVTLWQAAGIGTQQRQSTERQPFAATATYRDGHWHVFLTGPTSAAAHGTDGNYLSLALWDADLAGSPLPHAFTEWVMYELK